MGLDEDMHLSQPYQFSKLYCSCSVQMLKPDGGNLILLTKNINGKQMNIGSNLQKQ